MKKYEYNNIILTDNLNEANCVTHSGTFHVDDVIATIFLSKIFDKIILIRIPSIENIQTKNKVVYDIGFGEFDHHQKNRNGKRLNGIYYSSIGLLWKKYGKKYLRKQNVYDIDKTFNYIDEELIQYIDATDNMQQEYLKSKISPDFIKLYNPQWNENISENESFINVLKFADEFWNVYIKHAIAEVEAIQIILDKVNTSENIYATFDKDFPYRKAIKFIRNKKVKYLIFKSKRQGYDIRALYDTNKFKIELIEIGNINDARRISKVDDLIYVDTYGKLCCTNTLEGALKLIEYNEN